MKKILLFVAFALFTINANAQLNVTAASKAKVEDVITIRSTYSYLRCLEGAYYISGRTDNRFDKPFIFDLGTDAESSIETLKDMLRIIETETQIVEVEQNRTKFVISLQKMVGRYYLDIKSEGLAGHFNITIRELNKCIKAIKKREGITDKEEKEEGEQ